LAIRITWRGGDGVKKGLGMNRLRKKAPFWMKGPKNIPQGLKPHSFHCIYTGDKSPAYRREELFRSLLKPADRAEVFRGLNRLRKNSISQKVRKMDRARMP
jgi:hypothetical protein